jgi:hypothetical protein
LLLKAYWKGKKTFLRLGHFVSFEHAVVDGLGPTLPVLEKGTRRWRLGIPVQTVRLDDALVREKNT